MHRDYSWRQVEKEKLNHLVSLAQPRVGEIWTVKLWINIGSEENGKWAYLRPCLVLKRVWSLYFVVPCTTKGKDNNKFYKKIESLFFLTSTWESISSYILVTHCRTIDGKRFVKYKWSLSGDEFFAIKKLLQGVYF